LDAKLQEIGLWQAKRTADFYVWMTFDNPLPRMWVVYFRQLLRSAHTLLA
jgi:hypothetical protein